jgi:putative membrane protein
MSNRFVLTALAVTAGAAALAVGPQAQAQPYGWANGGWGPWGWGWYGPLHMVIWLFVLALIVTGVVWLARGTPHANAPRSAPRRPPGLDTLEERYARGEINRDEYLQKRRDILGE